ncbi:TetR family transcriptional regulator [Methylosinus sp. C49]|uniref:TetR/AcrR family transcriptional regulator n=1 Tax=Methylosinus sp. C49 TaxID=2699395 RepID=UPI001366FB55|nr:TetR/AcrR family transcriptional regulator [Methylosinus sp. C49]BBU63303.1 TetR family transcriptional regulator [Methylosinus sp. C49]
MRVSRAQAEENHEAVVNAASRLFREHGFDGIGLKDLMKGAGLTQGGFYKQFASKEDLIAQASRRAMETATRHWSDTIAAYPAAALEAVMAFYFSPEHRKERGDGCPLVALGGDAARQGPEVKAAFEAGLKAHLEVLDELAPSGEGEGPHGRAMTVLSLMVGAMMLSRTVNDEAFSRGFLEAAAHEVRRIAKTPRRSRRGAPPVTQAVRRAPDREQSHKGTTRRF